MVVKVEVVCTVANGKSSEWKVVSPYLFLLHMSTREVIFGDTLDTVYTDDIGISRAVKLKEIETDKKMEMEALALERGTFVLQAHKLNLNRSLSLLCVFTLSV